MDLLNNLLVLGVNAGTKVLLAIALWFVGRRLITLATTLTSSTLKGQRIDQTLISYLITGLSVLLNIVLVVAILGYFGIETTSFAALLAAAGVAIGAAWSGLLANFAAGAFLIVLRPFQVGDFVSAGGITGTVVEIGLFVTAIDTPDHVRTYVANNRLFGDNIQNFSTNSFRRVDLEAQVDHTVNPNEAARILRERIVNIPNVLSNPEPSIEVLGFNPMGVVLAVRPFCNNSNYWQVYFDTNRVIKESFSESGFPTPKQHFEVRQGSV
ncbi:MAG: mechanosensitive ion channel family protein [Oscillatoriales cyanobacterium SM2_2_1]|nr:mechanosensitive ion channel family protein [Oscillatoriales cyanobacterium SM2_2_1]